jgi:O-methyltransferase
VVQDGRGIPIYPIDVREILASANESAARDLASEIKRLKAQIASAEAENMLLMTAAETRTAELREHNRFLIESSAATAARLQQSEGKLTEALIEIATLKPENDRLRAEHAVISQWAARHKEHNRLLTESATETARKLHECEGKLTEALIEIATLVPENERLRIEHAVIAQRAAELEEHNHLLTESATETARKLQQRDAELTQTQIQIATLAPENERLRAEHAVISQRAAELEEHNQLLTASVTETARKLQEHDVDLTRMQIQLATLAPEDERIRLELAEISQRAVELEEHNQLLTASVTETARKLQERDAELTRTQTEIATLAPEDDRLRAEHAEISHRAAALQEHNRLLTESATETARKLQEREAELTRTQIEIATLAPENARLRAEHADISRRAAALQEHNRLLTESTTETARKLQESRETDYQILMAQQQLLAGFNDAEPRFHALYEKCRPYTMTSVERLYALYKSVEYIVSANLPGDLAEAGVWRGGSCMLIAETLLALGDRSRRIFLFDTFGGHPPPDSDKDVDLWGNRAIDEWRRRANDGEQDNWAHVSLDEVRANLARTGYPADKLVLVEGLLEETARDAKSLDKLALLRLDTDWHASTKAGLEHLYPRLVSGGVLILDDYGHYQGQRSAVDDYLNTTREPILLNRIDYSCRLGVKR